MASKTIHAAGGIVVRLGSRPRIAIVQRSKDELWVLPRGKLKPKERPVSAARREVAEETGCRVRVHEFVGAISYVTAGRPKVVQFWRMQAEAQPCRDLASDIMAVSWLPLAAAVEKLSHPLEKLFLDKVGREAILRSKRPSSPRLRSA
jgi:8-oxo-dGTP diphosphatase